MVSYLVLKNTWLCFTAAISFWFIFDFDIIRRAPTKCCLSSRTENTLATEPEVRPISETGCYLAPWNHSQLSRSSKCILFILGQHLIPDDSLPFSIWLQSQKSDFKVKFKVKLFLDIHRPGKTHVLQIHKLHEYTNLQNIPIFLLNLAQQPSNSLAD